VPLIANWPGTTPAGKVSDDLIDFSDFMPTFAESAGAKLPESVTIDGRSFAPQLRGKKGNPRRWAYCQWEGKAWARTQRFKLYRDGRLYDIENDPLEESPIRPGDDTDQTVTIRKKLQTALGRLKKV
jgi:arylsulfatase A